MPIVPIGEMARITLTLQFKTQAEADYVYGQLSDGWGENELDLGPVRGPKNARVVTCKPIGDDWERILPKTFTKKRVALLKKDFLSYSGGFEPHEAGDERDTYTRVNCPSWCTEEELDKFFEKWAVECEKRES